MNNNVNTNTSLNDEYEFFCEGLPTTPNPNIGKILITGSSGYIGGRLIPELLERGYHVRGMVRAQPQVYKSRWPNADIVVANALNSKSLDNALKDIDTAYYLLHSLHLGPKYFEEADLMAAKNFRLSAEKFVFII